VRAKEQALERVGRLAQDIGLEQFLDDAAATVVRLSGLPYNEYVKTPEWEQVKSLALERARHRCQVCNATKGLDVHHRSYENKPVESLDDLTVLCRPCHRLFHGNRDLERAA
jgi:hypothetical protein